MITMLVNNEDIIFVGNFYDRGDAFVTDGGVIISRQAFVNIYSVTLDSLPDDFTTDGYGYNGQLYPKVIPITKDQLILLQNAKIADIDLWRTNKNNTSFTYDGLSVECGPLERSDLDGMGIYVGLYNDFPAGFPGAWKAIDSNGIVQYISLPTVDHFKSLYSALVLQGLENYGQAEVWKAACAVATTKKQIDAIIVK